MPAIFYLRFLIVGMLFSSCATIFNTRSTAFYIRNPTHIKIDSVKGNFTKVSGRYVAKRSSDTMNIHLLADSTPLVLKIPAKKSFTYWENVLNLGIGFVIDRKTDKRYSYPKKIIIENENGRYTYRTSPIVRKGTVSFVPGLPYINLFRIKTNHNVLNSAGFIGMSFGLEYAVKTNRYLSLSAGITYDFPVIVPAPIKYGNEYHKDEIQYMSLRYHICKGRLDFGLGLNFSHSHHIGAIRSKSDSLSYVSTSQENIGLGLSLAIRYFSLKIAGVGLVYQPSFVGLSPANFGYQHLISLEFIFRLKWFKVGG